MINDRDNLVSEAIELREKIRQYTLIIGEMKADIPAFLDAFLSIHGDSSTFTSEKINQKGFWVTTNGIEEFYTEEQLNTLRDNNNAQLLMDMPRNKLTIKIPNCNKTVDLDSLPYPLVKILKCGMSHPGSPFPSNLFNSPDTLKSYVYAARKQLNDNKKPSVIKTCKKIYFSEGGYYFNPALRYIIIKTENPPSFNPKSTSP